MVRIGLKLTTTLQLLLLCTVFFFVEGKLAKMVTVEHRWLLLLLVCMFEGCVVLCCAAL
jgi:hypothetical protein